MPANLERAWQHLMSACMHMTHISTKVYGMLMDALAYYKTLVQVEEIRQRAYLAAALS